MFTVTVYTFPGVLCAEPTYADPHPTSTHTYLFDRDDEARVFAGNVERHGLIVHVAGVPYRLLPYTIIGVVISVGVPEVKWPRDCPFDTIG